MYTPNRSNPQITLFLSKLYRSMIGVLGNKGANLAEMSNLGINVPPGKKF